MSRYPKTTCIMPGKPATTAGHENADEGKLFYTTEPAIYVGTNTGFSAFDFEDSSGVTTLLNTTDASAFDGTFTSATIETMVTNSEANSDILGTSLLATEGGDFLITEGGDNIQSESTHDSSAEITDLVAKTHDQNTDTGTTETNFDINSGGNTATLETAAMTANATIDLNLVAAMAAGKLPSYDNATITATTPASVRMVWDSDNSKWIFYDTTSSAWVREETGRTA